MIGDSHPWQHVKTPWGLFRKPSAQAPETEASHLCVLTSDSQRRAGTASRSSAYADAVIRQISASLSLNMVLSSAGDSCG